MYADPLVLYGTRGAELSHTFYRSSAAQAPNPSHDASPAYDNRRLWHTSLPGARVVRALDRLTEERGAIPHVIVLDNGPALTSRALDRWAYERGVRLHFIDPGKPQQNGFIESFNGASGTSA